MVDSSVLALLTVCQFPYFAMAISEADLEGKQNFYRRAFLITFDFIWKVLLSDRIFATLLDSPLNTTTTISKANKVHL